MTGTTWRAVRAVVGALVVLAVLAHTGTRPFVDGVRALGPATLALGLLVAVPVTAACAWRWHLVCRGLGVRIAPATAVAACYRAQFLNATLPGGVLGDLHRGLSHGRSTGQLGRGLGSVLWERTAGQVVFVVLALLVLAAVPPPLAVPRVAWAAPAVLLLLAGALLLRRGLPGLRHAWSAVVVTSVVATAGHLATYLLAAKAVGVGASVDVLVPLAVLVLLAAGLPVNLAGWGPREGMAAWAFGAAGLGVDQGVATAVAYGVLVLVASLPGAVVLALSARPRPAGAPTGVAGGGLARG